MATSGTATAQSPENMTFVAKLAQFFPEATPVRIPIRVTGTTISGRPFSERTVIEYGTAQEVIFGSHLPLEFADKFRLENLDGSLNANATVVALHYCEGKTTAVAARFEGEVANWIIRR